MKNHVSAETALKLKNAGFPQPTPEAGNAWYDINGKGRPLFVHEVTNSRLSFVSIGNPGAAITPPENFNNVAFAPTATDILRELGSDYCIKADNSGFECILGSRISRNPQVWAHSSNQSVSFLLRYRHENPAEACAQAWLAKKSKERAFVQHQ